jgi:hypothetical protein
VDVTKKNRAERLARRAATVVSILEVVISPRITPHAGVTDRAIEAALSDRKLIVLARQQRSRTGATYRPDGVIILASAGLSGPYLHIGFEVEPGRVTVYHARLMNDGERVMYTRRR